MAYFEKAFDKKIEIRAYELSISAQNVTTTLVEKTDLEHTKVLDIFLHDHLSNGEAANLDMESTVTVSINNTEVLADAHAALFVKNPALSIVETCWPVNIPVNQSRIEFKYADAGQFEPADYPRKITLYAICEKK